MFTPKNNKKRKALEPNRTSYLPLKKMKMNTINSPLTYPIKISLRASDSMEIENPKRNNELSLLQKSQAYVSHLEGKTSKQISREIGSDRRVVRKLLFKAKTINTIESNHKSKGRWAKGDTKLNKKQKEFIERWLLSGEVGSAKQAWIRTNKIKNLPRVGLSCVNAFVKTKGSFVKPNLKSEVSEKNQTKRIQFCQSHSNFNFRNVLFTDESSFELNSNSIKVFQPKGQKKPQKRKWNPNYKIMIWGGISWLGRLIYTLLLENSKGLIIVNS